MFNKKLKTQIKGLKAKYDEVMSKNSGLYLENQSLKDELEKQKKEAVDKNIQIADEVIKLRKCNKTLNSKLISSEQFENDLKNKIAELEAENKELLNKITFRPESQPKKKPSKK